MSTAEELARSLELAEKRAVDARLDAKNLMEQNRTLQETLRLAKDRLQEARRQLEQLTEPPLSFATIVSSSGAADGTLDVDMQGRVLRVGFDPQLQTSALVPGSRVLLNESMMVVATTDRRDTGEIAMIKELLGSGDRAIIDGTAGEDLVVRLSPALIRGGVHAGETVLVDRRAGLAWATVPRQDVTQLALEEIPDVEYAQIGGLATQIEQVRDAVELPFLHKDLFRRYGLAAPKGVLLYGPPGTGKTMIAKAVAASLAHRIAAETGGAATSFFLNIKGPELLTKYVGETERQIRVIFQRARERAHQGYPVIVFFDEMDSLFRTRGTGVSSDVENTIVPQLLSEIDGVEGLENVIIIGASNREDMIDPAILRPGRLDVKIKLDRPDAAAAREIFAKYLTTDTPLAAAELAAHGTAEQTVQALIDDVVDYAYARQPRNAFLEVTYASGATQLLYFADFLSGAMIANIVNRAKKAAIKQEIVRGAAGVSAAVLRQACDDEFSQNEDLPNTSNPEEWARIAGRRGERITFLRTVAGGPASACV